MDEPNGSPDAVCDAQTLADLADLFGRARLDALLDGLDGEIVARLAAEAGDPGLGGDAHALVSVSGTLGFTALSRACARLERACLTGEPVAGPLAAARAEGARARTAIADLRRERG